jgi:hypothetical protein
MTLPDLLSQLESTAKAATPGPWKYEYSEPYCAEIIDITGNKLPGIAIWLDDAPDRDFNAQVDRNAAHIALCSPDTVLKLCAVVKLLIGQRDSANEFVNLTDKSLVDLTPLCDAALDAILEGK